MAKHSWCKIQFVDQGIFEIFAVRNWISFKISADFCLVSFSSAVAFRYWEWQPVSDSRIMLCGCISSEDGCHARISVNEWMNEWMNDFGDGTAALLVMSLVSSATTNVPHLPTSHCLYLRRVITVGVLWLMPRSIKSDSKPLPLTSADLSRFR